MRLLSARARQVRTDETQDSARRPRLDVLSVSATVGLLLSVLWFGRHTGIDGVAYIAIGDHYAHGDLNSAVNPYWGPLLSLMIAPLRLVGIAPVLAGTIATAASAVLCLVAVVACGRRLGATERASRLAAAASVPFLVAAVGVGVLADLLMAGLIVWTLAALDGALDQEAPSPLAYRAGAIAAAAVLAKSVAAGILGFAVLAMAAAVLLTMGTDHLRRTVAVLIRFAVVPLGVLVLWTGIISLDSGELTLPTQVGHNLDLAAPGSEGSAIYRPGLLIPGDPDARSAWEDPSANPVTGEGVTAAPRTSLRTYGRNLITGLRLARDLALDQYLAILLVGAAGAAAAWATRRRSAVLLAGLATASVVTVAGHSLVALEDRYLWTMIVAAFGLAAVAFDRLAGRDRIAAAVVLAALVFAPLRAGVELRIGSGTELDAYATEVGDALPSDAVVAADSQWTRSAILCVIADCRFVGIPDDPGAAEEMRAAGVTHVLIWDTESATARDTEGTPAVIEPDELTLVELP